MQITIREPGSAITHLIAMVSAAIAAVPLLLKAAKTPGYLHLAALAVFILSMICLYGASTLYHTLNISPVINKRLRKLDHMMIFVLIAGTYTPVCLIVLGDHTGWNLLGLVWGIALVGIIINALWITCPKWFSSIIYIAMGWVCIFAFGKIVSALPAEAFGWICILAISKIIAALPSGGFAWLLAGGIIYTVGGIIYALKLPIFNSRHRYFGSHEIFHLFVMGGSLCHYMMMYQFVA